MSTAVIADATRIDRIRVLLVEDSIDHQLLTTRALRKAGIDVVVAGSAEEALEILDAGAEVMHLALIDQGLPRMSGMDLLHRVVDMYDGPGAIMVTASAASELVVGAMRIGAVDFVSKESGYLEVLPAVVERAYRQFDLRQRTRELQRLALLVHRSTELEETVGEVVAGASRLLRAHAAVLLLEDDDQAKTWRTAARIGDPDRLSEATASALAGRGLEIAAEGGILAVRLPVEIDEQTGALVVARDEGRPWLLEEEELARTFAAYVSSALRHVRRAELEGGLIEELQQTIRARRDFVASISHELRTPLTSIRGYAETIVTRTSQLEPDQQMDLVKRIYRHSLDLERMIDQLLDVASMERGNRFTPSLEDLDLAELLRACVVSLRPNLAGCPVSLDVPTALVSADRELVERVMANLLTNAVKYSPSGGAVEVTARRRELDVEVVVRDHGIGIDPNDAVLVFQPFWRAKYAVAQAVRGAGIGLALVREYVTGMGGEVGVRSPQDGSGSAFWFTLPLATGATAGASPSGTGD